MRASEEETEDTTPLALGFELKAEQLTKTRFSWGYEPFTMAHLEAGKSVYLSIRPLRRGKRNNWIKSGLSWRTFEYRMNGRGFDPAHADALTRIFALSEADRSHTAAVEQLWINQFRSPILWEALARAREAGVAFVGLENVGEVRLGEGADVGLDLTGADDLTVRALAHIDGEPRPEARMLGSNGVIDIRQGARDTFDIEFAATSAPVPMPVQKLLEARTRIDVPKSDREAFFDSALPRLNRVTSVASGDGSVTMPAPKSRGCSSRSPTAVRTRLHSRGRGSTPQLGIATVCISRVVLAATATTRMSFLPRCVSCGQRLAARAPMTAHPKAPRS